MGKIRNADRILLGNSEGKRLVGRIISKWTLRK
jgi:hypothetical protein